MHDTLIVLWLIIIILLLIFNQSKNVSEAKLTRGGGLVEVLIVFLCMSFCNPVSPSVSMSC